MREGSTDQKPIRGRLARLMACTILAAAPCAQTAKVLHVWVDPVYGDDARAGSAVLYEANPGVDLANPPLFHNGCYAFPYSSTFRPNDVVNSQAQVLLHAPWPFKTITAALGYVPPLPYTSPLTGVTWAYAIVHLLPGRYARGGHSEPHNGIAPNGETFPIRLPNRVSIQGTSFLNTILEIDGRNDATGPIFEFGTSPGTVGTASFITSVTLTGTRRQLDPAFAPRLAAAVYLAPDHPSSPTIVNTLLAQAGHLDAHGVAERISDLDLATSDVLADWHRQLHELGRRRLGRLDFRGRQPPLQRVVVEAQRQ